MIARPIALEEKDLFNRTVTHPLQSWEWGEFKKANGQKVERIGFFEGNKLQNAIQVTFHSVPGGRSVGYLPKGPMPDDEQIMAMQHIAKKNDAIFIKIEPNIMLQVGSKNSAFQSIHNYIFGRGGRPAKAIFSPHTFLLDLTKSPETLMTGMSAKTRYNVRLAIKKGVQIIDDTSEDGIETFIRLMDETSRRQRFYAHDAAYFRQLFRSMGRSGTVKIFHAVYDRTVLVSWIVFVFNDRIYYPYGASSALYREVMASNLMMWETIQYGQSVGAKAFDMWGALGPDPNPKDPWLGFHNFKRGYGAALMENFPTYDFVYDQAAYKLFQMADKLRWTYLRTKKLLSRQKG